MKLVQLIYTSRAKSPITLDLVRDILLKAETHNQSVSISGFLAFDDRHFLQLIEGGSTAVNELYLKLARDARHESVRLVGYGEAGQRLFPAWSMGDASIGALDKETIFQFMPTGTFEPEKLTAESAIRLLTLLERVRQRTGDRHVL